ncbi:MAG: hypothetical protein VR68_15740 [Peptococcaceae bacterium BRH_c4a]|nr:MAG: hypothetical protein VR68_15740 [Peptococcaceae bacterium BRH_c4a]
MRLITIKLQGLKNDDSSNMLEIIMGIRGIELIDYDPGQNEAVIICQSQMYSDDLILEILEAGLQFKRYYVAEQLTNTLEYPVRRQEAGDRS